MSVLYISDLDGTLLTNEPSLSEFSRATLMDLLASGLPFSVASARSVVSIRKMLRNLPLSLPVVEFNGAFLSDLETGRHGLINDLKPHVAREIYELLLKFDPISGSSSKIDHARAGSNGISTTGCRIGIRASADGLQCRFLTPKQSIFGGGCQASTIVVQ